MARQVVDLESPIGAFQVAKETLSRLRTNIPTVVTVEGARLEADLNTTAVEMIARAGASNLYRPKKRTERNQTAPRREAEDLDVRVCQGPSSGGRGGALPGYRRYYYLL